MLWCGRLARILLAAAVSGTPSSTPLEAYTYLGLGSIVQRAHPQSSVNLSYINSSATTGNRYSGLDAFGRIIDQNWTKTSTSTAVDRFQYAYDRVGDVLYKNDLVVPANSELYQANGTASNSAYDPLGRITSFKRGTLSASGSNGSQLDQVSSSSANGSWTYDALGKWTSQTTGSSTISRTFNAQNQTATTGSGTLPVYDRNGNEVVDAQGYTATPITPGTSPSASSPPPVRSSRPRRLTPTMPSAGGLSPRIPPRREPPSRTSTTRPTAR